MRKPASAEASAKHAASSSARRRLRVLVLMHDYLVPPDDVSGHDLATAEWRTEYDVLRTIRDELQHDVQVLGVKDELGPIRQVNAEFKPHIAFNLLEAFHEVGTFDQNVVSYLELLRLSYTGCNPRGMLLARDKALSKKLMHYHRIPAADFFVVPRGRKARTPKRLSFPVIVKSLTQEASIGISQASVVEDAAKLQERVQFIHDSITTDAIVEQYVEGRELYCGVIGNQRLQVLPVWEMTFANMPESQRRIATERVKWSQKYQKRVGIETGPAAHLPPGAAERIQHISRRVYQVLQLSGYARIDLRLDAEGRVYVLEANPNPQIASAEDFAQSASAAGLSYAALLQRILTTGLRWEPERAG
jgi:D-alanine-D-alanine ligase